MITDCGTAHKLESRDYSRFLTDQIYNIWLPAAIRYGIDIRTFWTLNPKIMFAYQDAYIEMKRLEFEQIETGAYLNGIYNLHAMAAAFDGKKNPYPKQLLLSSNSNNEEENLTEEQKIEYQKKLLMQLQVMQSNFETCKVAP